MLATSALCAGAAAGQAWAQGAATGGGADAPVAIEEIVVTGTRIEGAKVTAALPVTVVDQKQMDAVAAVSGDDLFRSIPQMGDVTFNSGYLANSSNSARGDVGSVNLRNLGVGNTLVLLNGRRVVAHPTSQANEFLVPVVTYNTNAIPTFGLKRIEVLRDGAAAICGADAVAGVVNTVTRDNFNGVTLEAQYGGAEGTHLKEFEFNAQLGHNFSDGRGNISAQFNYDDRTGLRASDQDYTASADKRPLFAGTAFDGAGGVDGRNTTTPWANLTTQGSVNVTRNGVSLTNKGQLHIQPSSAAGCAADLGGGICINPSAAAYSGVDRYLRYDSSGDGTYVMPAITRENLFLTGHYDVTDEVTAYGEVGYYHAKSHSVQTPVYMTTAQGITVPGSNYWNPFGATGSPNRLSGVNAPAGGLNLTMTGYAFADAGPQSIDVENSQYRVLAGLKGKKWGFNWDSGLLYSEAEVEDVSDGISATALQKQLALSTPDAYNPFNGGDPNRPSFGDTTPSSAAAINAIRVKAVRKSTSTLAMWDFKVSRPDLYRLPAGDLGVAAGVEYRRETQKDDRDARVDGTITFTNPITGVNYGSDLIGVSPSPDTKGSRNVSSAYVEFAVPLVSPEMNIPFVHNLEAQVAGRYESYSDVGDVAKPKIALAWDIIEGVRLRGSWAQGFRPPNLEQINATLVTRSNTRTDWIYCQADLNSGRIKSFADCTRRGATQAQRAGNPDLKPEESESFGGGLVLEPRFIPSEYGRFTFTLDYWRIKQEGIIGIFGEGNALTLDYLLRMQGQTNPNVIRAAPTPADIAAFAGTGIAPVGQVQYVKDQYVNLQPQEARGLDIGVMWRLHGTRYGDFDFNFNAAHLLKFYQQPSAGIAALLAARASGVINPGTTITGNGDLIRQGGKPEWKWSAAATWRYKQVTVGAFTQYIGDVDENTLLDANGNPWLIDSQLTANLYADYEFVDGGWWTDKTRVRVGVKNVTDEKPPLSYSSGNGYLGTLYQPYSRYWYVSVRKSF